MAVVGALDGETFPLKKLLEKPAQLNIVVDDQQPHPALS
jgi:hypothetical protein